MADYVPALIRDARGITSSEALFLFTVDSRGKDGMYTTAEKAAADMKMSLRTFRTTRKSLVAKGLIHVKERPPRTSIYTVATPALAALTSATSTSAETARVTRADIAGVPEQSLHGSPVQILHTEVPPVEGEQEGPREHPLLPPGAGEGAGAGIDFYPATGMRSVAEIVASTPKPSAVVDDTTPDYPNKKAGRCADCGVWVERAKGERREDEAGTWQTYHLGRTCPAKSNATIPTAYTPTPTPEPTPEERAAIKARLAKMSERVRYGTHDREKASA